MATSPVSADFGNGFERRTAETILEVLKRLVYVSGKPMVAAPKRVCDAIQGGDVEVVRRYLEKGGDPDAPGALGKFGHTLLHNAAGGTSGEASAAIVALLLEHGADVNSKTSHDGNTPLYCAAAAEQCNAAIVCLLVDAGADVRACDTAHTPLHVLCRGRDSLERREALRTLVNAGADLHAKDWLHASPAYYARDPAFLAFLVEHHGVSVTSLRRSGVSALFGVRSRDLAAYLVGNGVDPHERVGGSLGIHDAAARFRASIVQFFVDRGVSVDAPDDKGFTPLHYAATSTGYSADDQEARLATVTALIDLGARTTGAAMETALEELLMRAVNARSSALQWLAHGSPIPPQRRVIRWVLSSSLATAAMTSIATSESLEDQQRQRDARLSQLRDDAWERRKHLVVAFMLERQRRKAAAAATAAPMIQPQLAAQHS